MRERMKMARKALHITQAKMAEDMHVSKSLIEAYEYGRSDITDRAVADVCRLYNVSETWLRSGEGEMFLPLNRDEELAKIANNLYESDPSELTVKLMRVVAQMSESEVELLVEVARKIAKEFEAKE